jgi:hypothetical protein
MVFAGLAPTYGLCNGRRGFRCGGLRFFGLLKMTPWAIGMPVASGLAQAQDDTVVCVILNDQRERRISGYGQGVGLCFGAGWVVVA